jgi:hypothetical protein
MHVLKALAIIDRFSHTLSMNNLKLQTVSKVQSTDLIDIARRYKALMAEMEQIERMVKPYRDTLELAAMESNGVIDLGTYRITVTPVEREVFSIKSARESLGYMILKPFLRVSKFNQLRIVEK